MMCVLRQLLGSGAVTSTIPQPSPLFHGRGASAEDWQQRLMAIWHVQVRACRDSHTLLEGLRL